MKHPRVFKIVYSEHLHYTYSPAPGSACLRVLLSGDGSCSQKPSHITRQRERIWHAGHSNYGDAGNRNGGRLGKHVVSLTP